MIPTIYANTGIKDNYKFTEENVTGTLEAEVGKTFVKVLEDAGVYKCTKEGRDAFLRFTKSVGAEIK